MPTATETPKIEIRQRIVDEATRLFARQGFDGTSVQEIAEAVGIRKPSLLYHFGSKETLRREVLDNVLAHWKSELPRLMTAASTGKDRFASGVQALVSFFTSHPDRARLLLREALDDPDAVSDMLAEHIRPWTGLITGYIRMGQETGQVRDEVDADAYVLQVVGMVIGTVALGTVTRSMLDSGGPTPIDQMKEMMRIARRSLFNTRPAPPAEQ